MKYEVMGWVDQMTHDQWLDARSTGIGGSDLASIYNESPWTSAYTLWAEKSGRVPRENTTNDAMEWGNLLEDVVAQRFATECDAAVVKWPVMLRSLTHPFMLANLDFLLVEPDDQFKPGTVTLWTGSTPPPTWHSILEIKTTGIVGRGSADQWRANHVPRGYELQGLHYSAVTGCDAVVFACLVAGEGLVVRGRLYGDNEIRDAIDRETAFWESVKTGTEPALDGTTSTSETIGKMFPRHVEGVTVEADDFLMDTLADYRAAKERQKALDEEVQRLRSQLELALGEAEAMTHEGQTLFTYKATKDSETFDAKAFKEAHPDLAAKFVKPKPGYRVLRLKGE